MKKILYGMMVLILISCKKEPAINFKEETVLHALIIEGKVPKIILVQTLEAFPEYPFNIEYYNQPFKVDFYYPNTEIKVISDGKVFNNFKERNWGIDDPYENMPKLKDSLLYFSDELFVAEAGKTYEIEINEITYPYHYRIGFDYLKAKTTVPEKIPIHITQKKNIVNESSQDVGKLTYEIAFNDPANKNYYYLLLSRVSCLEEFIMDTIDMDKVWLQKFPGRSFWFSNLKKENVSILNISNQPDKSDIYNYYKRGMQGFLIPDSDFNGQTKKIQLQITSYPYEVSNTSYIVAELMHLSEEFYNYYRAIEKQGETQIDVFSEPVQIYTNVENGFGIFAGASMSTSYIKVESKP